MSLRFHKKKAKQFCTHRSQLHLVEKSMTHGQRNSMPFNRHDLDYQEECLVSDSLFASVFVQCAFSVRFNCTSNDGQSGVQCPRRNYVPNISQLSW